MSTLPVSSCHDLLSYPQQRQKAHNIYIGYTTKKIILKYLPVEIDWTGLGHFFPVIGSLGVCEQQQAVTRVTDVGGGRWQRK